MQTNSFLDNTIDTAWLDALIADRIQSEKPDIILGVICGALHIAERKITEAFGNFQVSLEKYGNLKSVPFLETIIKFLFSEDKFKRQMP